MVDRPQSLGDLLHRNAQRFGGQPVEVRGPALPPPAPACQGELRPVVHSKFTSQGGDQD